MRGHHENDLLPKRNLLKQLQPTGSKQLDYYAAPFRLCTVSTCHESGRCPGKEFLHFDYNRCPYPNQVAYSCRRLTPISEQETTSWDDNYSLCTGR